MEDFQDLQEYDNNTYIKSGEMEIKLEQGDQDK